MGKVEEFRHDMEHNFEHEPAQVYVKPTIEKALRYNEGKLHWSLVDFRSIEPMVRVLEYGTKKYSRDNWKKGLDKLEVLESMMRHLTALIDNEQVDPESKQYHIGHIMANCMFYHFFHMKEEGNKLIDRLHNDKPL